MKTNNFFARNKHCIYSQQNTDNIDFSNDKDHNCLDS